MEKKGKKKWKRREKKEMEKKEKKEMDKKMQRRKRVPGSKTANLAISSFLTNTSRQQESAEASREEKSWKNLATPPNPNPFQDALAQQEQREAQQGCKGKTCVKAQFCPSCEDSDRNPREMSGTG